MKIAFVNLIHTALSIILPQKCAGCKLINKVFCEPCANSSYKKGAQCLICGFRNMDGKICRACTWKPSFQVEARLPRIQSVLWVGRYDGALREAIWQFKYKKRKELAAPLAEMLWKKFCEIWLPSQRFSKHAYSPAGELLCSPRRAAQGFENRSLEADWLQNAATRAVIIPIPLHFKKEHERGFNQAELLAREFSRLSHFQLLTNSLLKIKETKAQVEVENKKLRISNLENAFQVNPKISKSDISRHFINNFKQRSRGPAIATQSGQLLASNTIILIDDVATTGATLFHAASALQKAGAKKIMGLVLAHGG